jgi:hypothetical protein
MEIPDLRYAQFYRIPLISMHFAPGRNGMASRISRHDVLGRGLSAFYTHLQRIARFRLSLSRQNYCGHQLRPYLPGAQKNRFQHGSLLARRSASKKFVTISGLLVLWISILTLTSLNRSSTRSPEVVTYVASTFCNPCLRLATENVGAESGS